MFADAHQFAFELRDQFTHRFANRTPSVVEKRMPVGKRILVHRTTLPAPHAGDGRNQIGADASFDLHELRIPSNFLDGSEGFEFFGAFAFGLQGSLFERFCPLAILPVFIRAVFPRPGHHARGTRVEARFQTIKQTCPGAPRLGAAFERGTDMALGGR